MLCSKSVVGILILYFVNASLSKPTDEYITESRGIGSTIWGWITYPFSWWSSNETEQPPEADDLVAPTTYTTFDTVTLGKPNITVWCNDQTCTTMKCDTNGCRNITCNIYDTYVTGMCREYDMTTKPDVYTSPEPTGLITNPFISTVTASLIKEPVDNSPVSLTTQKYGSQPIEEYPLELEAALSSTVSKLNVDKLSSDKSVPASPQNKI